MEYYANQEELTFLTENLYEHHTSLCRGYVSRKDNLVRWDNYAGRFGKGIRVYSPNYESTQYCYVTYWVKD